MFVSEVFDEASEILGTTDQSKVFRVLTQAVQALMESGHWLNSQKEVDVCTGWDGQTITLPKDVEIPLAIQVDGTPVYFRSKYFEYHVNRGGTFDNVNWAWDDKGIVATIEDIRQPSQLVAVAEHDNDAGKQIRVVGTDRYNRPLRTQLPDGTLLDGKMVTVHSQKDFSYGTITPDAADIDTRTAAVAPLSSFSTSDGTPHTLTTGEPMVFTLGTATTAPDGLVSGDTYYVGSIDANNIELYSSSFDAENGTNPLKFTSIPTSGTLVFTDSRVTVVESGVLLSVTPAFSVPNGTEVTFSGANLPPELTAGLTYFCRYSTGMFSGSHGGLLVYSTLLDAQNDTNRLNVSAKTNSNPTFTVNLRKPIAPQTTLVFSNKLYFVTGESVQVVTNGGTLPQPLVAGVNYYVYKIDSFTITLHTTLSDATAGVNPIIFTTAGNGNVFVAKLIPATVTPGVTANVNVAGQIVPPVATPTTTATVKALATGPVTSSTVVTAGTGYTTTAPTATIYEFGGYGYAASTSFNTTVSSAGASGYSYAVASDNTTLSKGYAILQCTTNAAGVVTQVKVINVGYGFSVGDLIYIFSGSGTGAMVQVTSVNGSGSLINNDATSVNTTTGATVGKVTAGSTITMVSTSALFGVQATGTVSIASGSISGFSITSGGAGYMSKPKVGLSAGNGAVAVDFTPSFVSSYLITNPGAGYSAAPYLKISSGGDNTASAISTISSGKLTSVKVIAAGTSYTTAPLVSVTPTTGSFVTFSSTGTLPSPLKTGVSYRVEDPTPVGFTVKNADFTDLQITDSGSGNLFVELSDTFGYGFNNLWQGDFSGIAAGTGIQLQTDYQLPGTNPASSPGTTYYVTPTSATTAKIFTDQTTSQAQPYSSSTTYAVGAVATLNGVYWKNISSGTLTGKTPSNGGSGAVIGVNVDCSDSGTFLITDAYVIQGGSGYFATPTVALSNTGGGAGATFSVQTDPTTGAVTGVTVLTHGTSGYNCNTAAAIVPNVVWQDVSTTTLLKPTTLGVGQSYYTIPDTAAVTAPTLGSKLIPETISYLSRGQRVQFSSTGTLPAGLSASTDYYLIPNSNGFSVSTTPTGSKVSITSTGTGAFSMVAQRTMVANPSTYIVADASLLETGDAVFARPASGDILPPSLASTPGSALDPVSGYAPSDGTAVYVRRLSENYLELYDTKAHAQAFGATTGRLTYTTIGNTISSTFLLDSSSYPTLVKTVAHVDKPTSDGYISLYAWDYGRSNDMTLIGQYHPNEVNPRYRRIRIGKPAAWVRILYRVKCPTISSVYDYIPLEQSRAVINAVHAVDLENKDFFEQSEKYWAKAYKYLTSQQDALDGHAMTPIQVNGIVYGDKTDCVMF